MHRAHAFAAAARGCLDHHGQADPNRFGGQLTIVLILAIIARHHGHAGGHREPPRLDLRAHGADRLEVGPHPHDAILFAQQRQVGLFGQKTITRMNGVRAAGARGGHDPVRPQIAVACGRGTDRHGDVGKRRVHGLAIGLGINSDGAQSHPPRGADDADRDLAAIGDQECADHVVLHIR